MTAVGAMAADQPGNIDIRSTLVGTRVYLDDAYVGDADIFIEDVPPGEHVIILRQGSQRIRGEFKIRPGELLMLEGRFAESRIVDLRQIAREEAEKRAEAARKAEEQQRAAEAESKKREQLDQKTERVEKKAEKKAEKKEEKKTEQQKTAVAVAKPSPGIEEERRDLHLNILRVDFHETAGGTDVRVTPKANEKVVTNFNDSAYSSGKMYRSKQNDVLCEGSGCSRDWTGRFFYFDDAGKRDAFLIRWRETVFTGITPSGTSKVEVDLCVNGDCKRAEYTNEQGPVVRAQIDRYALTFNRSMLTIRRADIMKEITRSGGQVPDY